ncbi:hypothetical protein, partial [uncultured Campylobacter sp.]|uniref:hypothetical protein n=1 Tax=uncultured Campylobacter sp. TaxID=218934 RepID=UPI00262FA72A
MPDLASGVLDYFSQKPTSQAFAFILKKSNLKRTSSNLATFQTHTAKTGGTNWNLNLTAHSLWTSLIRSP